MKLQIRLFLGIGITLLSGALQLTAGTVTYNFGDLSGGTPPAGSPPWIQAIFTDNGLPADTVQLTLNAGNLTGNEYVSCWYFNFDPTLNPASLKFAVSSSSGTFTDPTVMAGMNGFKAGPDGKYDVLLSFSTTGGDSTRFTSGDSLTFTITRFTGLTADDFNQLSTCAGGSGSYSSAADIQSIEPGDGNGWINPTATLLANGDQVPTVPDGGLTIALLGASLLMIEFMRRKMPVRAPVRVRRPNRSARL